MKSNNENEGRTRPAQQEQYHRDHDQQQQQLPVIRTLPQEVINRIAAGEVVQRPSSALKELLENSIDAGASSIQVCCREGGLSLMQVSDNGHGIQQRDLPLLCERFATSKLSVFDDLASIETFGFRGEALASISHVAKVSVTTFNPQVDATASTTEYVDGKIVSGPTPCAGTQGTTIKVTDLFYNSPMRKKTLLRASDEYNRIVEVLSRYALAFPLVGFACKKEGASRHDALFPRQSTTLGNIRVLFGTAIASKLQKLSFPPLHEEEEASRTTTKTSSTSSHHHVSGLRFGGFCSDVTLSNKKFIFVLFINNRLVESTAIRRAIEQAYATVLVGGNRPFVVLFVHVNPSQIDVNVHPTKHEVFLLHEDYVLQQVHDTIRLALSQQRHVDPVAGTMSQGGGGGGRVGLGLGKAAQQRQLQSQPANIRPVVEDDPRYRATQLSASALAPSSTVRVDKQRGDMLKFVVPTERFGGEIHQHQHEHQQQHQQQSTVASCGVAEQQGGRVKSSTNPPTVVVLDDEEEDDQQRYQEAKPSAATTVSIGMVLDEEEEEAEAGSEPSKKISADHYPCPAAATCQNTDTHHGNTFGGERSAEIRSPEGASDTGRSSRTTGTAVDQFEAQPKALQFCVGSRNEGGSDEDEEDEDDISREFRQAMAAKERARKAATAASVPTKYEEIGDPATANQRWGGVLLPPKDQQTPCFSNPTATSSTPAAASSGRKRERADDISLLADVDDVLLTCPSAPSAPASTAAEVVAMSGGRESARGEGTQAQASASPKVLRPPPRLTSVGQILATLRQQYHEGLAECFKQMSFVGLVNPGYFLAQSGTVLYMLETEPVVRTVVFQRCFTRWAEHKTVSLCLPPPVEPPPVSPSLTTPMGGTGNTEDEGEESQPLLRTPHGYHIASLLRMALLYDPDINMHPTVVQHVKEGTLSNLLEAMLVRLEQWAELLRDYFGIGIVRQKGFVAKPSLLLSEEEESKKKGCGDELHVHVDGPSSSTTNSKPIRVPTGATNGNDNDQQGDGKSTSTAPAGKDFFASFAMKSSTSRSSSGGVGGVGGGARPLSSTGGSAPPVVGTADDRTPGEEEGTTSTGRGWKRATTAGTKRERQTSDESTSAPLQYRYVEEEALWLQELPLILGEHWPLLPPSSSQRARPAGRVAGATTRQPSEHAHAPVPSCEAYLPSFLVRLACDVDYRDEQSAFLDIASELSYLYAEALYSPLLRESAATDKVQKEKKNKKEEEDDDEGLADPEQRIAVQEEPTTVAASTSSTTDETQSRTLPGPTAHTQEGNKKTRGEGSREYTAFEETLVTAIRFGLVPLMTGPAIIAGQYFFPPAEFVANKAVASIVTVEQLYKVFERC